MRSASGSDWSRLAKLLGGFVIARVLPRSLDRQVVPGLLRRSVRSEGSWVARVEGQVLELLGSHLPEADFRAIALGYCQMIREIQWLRCRAFWTRDVWIETNVDGLHRLTGALERGRGAILWGASFCETLPVRIALYRAGIGLVGLSSVTHGAPSPHSRFGVQLIAPLYSAPDDRFVSERVNVASGGGDEHLRVLKEKLGQNECVYIKGDHRTSHHRNIPASVFSRSLDFTPLPPALAWDSKSPLFPVHVVREGPGRYRAAVHPAIEANRRDRSEFIHASVKGFAAVLERVAAQDPSSWERKPFLGQVFGEYH